MHAHFKNEIMSLEDNDHSEQPSTSKTPKNFEKFWDITNKDRHQTIHKLSDMVGIGYAACQNY